MSCTDDVDSSDGSDVSMTTDRELVKKRKALQKSLETKKRKEQCRTESSSDEEEVPDKKKVNIISCYVMSPGSGKYRKMKKKKSTNNKHDTSSSGSSEEHEENKSIKNEMSSNPSSDNDMKSSDDDKSSSSDSDKTLQSDDEVTSTIAVNKLKNLVDSDSDSNDANITNYLSENKFENNLLDDFSEKEQLEIVSFGFDLLNIGTDDEVFLMNIPNSLNPKLLEQLKFKLHKAKHMQLGDDRFILKLDDPKESEIILLRPTANNFRIDAIPIKGILNIKQEHEVQTESLPDFKPKTSTVPFPIDLLQTRHPLFGRNYEKSIELDPGINKKLTERIVQKKKIREPEKNEADIFNILKNHKSKRKSNVEEVIEIKKEKISDVEDDFSEKKKKKKKKDKKKTNEDILAAILETMETNGTEKTEKKRKKITVTNSTMMSPSLGQPVFDPDESGIEHVKIEIDDEFAGLPKHKKKKKDKKNRLSLLQF